MQTITLAIPASKIPALATAAILDGSDLGSWIVDSVDNSPLCAPSVVSVPESSVVLDSLPETQPEPEEAPIGDFFANLV